MNATATEKQQNFITRLLAEKNTAGTYYDGWEPDWSASTPKSASAVIDFLLTLPRKQAEEAAPVEAGVYTDGDKFVRVYFGQQSGQMLAKEIHLHSDGPEAEAQYVEYAYLGRAANVITSDYRRMTLEEVGSLGKRFDHCLLCGRRLDDPESVDRGVGPICARKYGAVEETGQAVEAEDEGAYND